VSTLAVAIERKEWELVSLCLLVGVVEAAAALPPDAVEVLLEVLAGLDGEGGRSEREAPPFDPSTGLRAGRLRTGPSTPLRRGRGRRR
jgi:hypothetical protein